MTGLDTLFVGQVLYELPRVASTNEHALALLSKNNPPEGTVISTHCQTAGRGQLGSHWESEPGKNITLSIIFYPAFLQASQQFLLSQTIALGVADFLEQRLPGKIKIKWPNDVYAGDKKIAGILIQNVLRGSHLRSCVAGIGINVNQVDFLTNPPNPTSLKMETSKDFNLGLLTPLLFKAVEEHYLKLKTAKIVHLQQLYLQRLYRLKTPTRFQRADGTPFGGTIEGVTDAGRLIVNSGERTETFDAKEIKLIV